MSFSASNNRIANRRPKAVALLSGGLDSRLAVRLILDQGVEVLALHYESPLALSEGGEEAGAARCAARVLGIPLEVHNTWDEILRAVNRPRHGHGKGVNPCIDCRIIHFRLAKAVMEREGADFIVSGEVLGQRPMSQHKRALATIEREAGVEGKVLRPLSALLFPPTEPERRGLVDRRRLRGFKGRNRKPQMALAEELGLKEYPSPAGGCVLTEPGFGVRYRRLQRFLADKGLGEIDVNRAKVLVSGRHFVSSEGEWITIARNDQENCRLLELQEAHRIFAAVGYAPQVGGPVAAVLAAGSAGSETLREAADLAARYGQGRGADTVRVTFADAVRGTEAELAASPRRGYALADVLERV
ncbi:MAG: hypothetical protein Kow00129_04430 [Thermoleophilia bacterium]